MTSGASERGRPTSPPRVGWVDAARGIGILLVVFGHSWRGLRDAQVIASETLFERVDATIYLFHMPLFFFVSGLFLTATVRRRGVWASFPGRCWTLLYPLVIWTYVIRAFQAAAAGSINGGLAWSDLLRSPLPPQAIFWFLWALLLIQTAVSPVIAVRDPRLRRGLWLAMLALAWLGLRLLPPDDPWLRQSLANLPYLVLGVWLGRGRVDHPAVGVALAGLLAFVGLLAAAPTLLAAAPAVRIAAGAACVIGFVSSLAWLDARLGDAPAWRLVQWLGGLSMPIYLAHLIFTAGMRVALLRLGETGLLVHVGLGTLAGIAGPLVVYRLAVAAGATGLLGFPPASPHPSGSGTAAKTDVKA